MARVYQQVPGPGYLAKDKGVAAGVWCKQHSHSWGGRGKGEGSRGRRQPQAQAEHSSKGENRTEPDERVSWWDSTGGTQRPVPSTHKESLSWSPALSRLLPAASPAATCFKTVSA